MENEKKINCKSKVVIDEDLLIFEVQRHSFLYDAEMPEYSNKHLVTLTWNNIASKLGAPGQSH